MDRREFLKRSAKAAVAAGASLPIIATAAEMNDDNYESTSIQSQKLQRLAAMKAVDPHLHMVPDFYVQKLAEKGITTSMGVSFPEWSPQHCVGVMDQLGIQAGVLSLSTPGVFLGPGTEFFAIELAREVNEFAAATVDQFPDRFGFFAALPMPLVNESIAEAVYALDVLKADGISLLSTAGDKFLGDPMFEDLMDELNSRESVVFLHPNPHSSTKALIGSGLNIPNFAVEAPVDTTRAVVNMIMRGIPARYPNIKWLLAHAGGTLPYLVSRISLLKLLLEPLGKWPWESVEYYLKKMYYDTALSTSSETIAACMQLLEPSQIVFGSDYPFAPAEVVGMGRLDLATNVYNSTIPLFKKPVYEGILTGALDLFPSLASRVII